MTRERYRSDLTDNQWNILAPLFPPAKPGGRPRTVDLREVVSATLYVLRTGCAWRMLPHDLPPWQTVYKYFRKGGEHRGPSLVGDACVRTGCAWRMLPHDLPPWQTVYKYFRGWRTRTSLVGDAVHEAGFETRSYGLATHGGGVHEGGVI